MANSVSIFAFQQNQVRTVTENAEIWFAAIDVCAALNIDWSGKTLAVIPDDWQRMGKLPTLRRGSQNLKLISEPAVYKLAFRSNKPEADAFTNWVASEVLPAIRKTGKYEPTPKPKKKLAALPLRSLPRVEQKALASDHAAALAIKALNPAPGLSGEFYEAELLRVFRDFAAWRTGVLARMEALERDYSRVTGLLHRDVLRRLMEGTPFYMTDMGAWAMGESYQDAVKAVREGVAKWECLFSKAQWFAKTLRVNW